MAVRTIATFDEQTSVTGTSDDFIVSAGKEVSVVTYLSAGTPTTGCRVMVTLDQVDKINAGTAVWVASPLGAHTTSSAEKIQRPVTGVRLSVTDGTWTIQVRQN